MPLRLQLAWGLLLLLAAASAAAAPALVSDDLDRSPCEKNRRRKTTLKLLKEAAFAGLFRDLKNSTKFEASAVEAVNGEFYVVFDNAMAVGRLNDRFSFRDPTNKLVGDWEPESQFEGIAYKPHTHTFLLLHEALEHRKEGTFKPYIREVRLDADMSDYTTLAMCEVDYEMEWSNKGLEEIDYIQNSQGDFLMGLCEGNWCKGGEEGQEPGNGRILVTQVKQDKEHGCLWEVVKEIKIPEGAFFQDYAAMAYNRQTGKLAVMSQEDAAIWIGDFDPEALEFKSQEGDLFHLPRDNHCEIVYCNAEGLQWIDNYRVVVASDKAKSRQPFWCDAKDQMLHIFSLPLAWDPFSPAGAATAALLAEEAAEEEERRAAAAEL